MRMQKLVISSTIGLSLLLGGCTENDQSIYRTVDLSKGSTLLTDAKTRTVLNIAPGSGSSPGYVVPSRIICAEPSPDVAQAVSKSFGAELSAAIASEGSGQAQIAAAQAASVAELGKRLAAVQALRDGLYRACEAYANGAMTDASYAAILGGYRTTLETTLFGDFLSSRGSTSALVSATSNANTTGSANETSQQSNNNTSTQGSASTQPPASSASPPSTTTTTSGTTAATANAAGTQGTDTGPSLPPDQVAKSMQAMHRTAMIHDMFDYHPIVAACVVATDRRAPNGGPVTQPTAFARFCSERILPDLAQAIASGDVHLEKILKAMIDDPPAPGAPTR
jgi:hypothetical protein